MRPFRKAYPALLTDDLTAVLQFCENFGVAVTFDVPLFGCDRAHILDPFGHRIELPQKRIDR